jgi:hypothetical protein
MRHRALPLLAVLIVAAGCQPQYNPDPDPTVGSTRLTPAWTTDLPDGSGQLILAEAVADGFVIVRQSRWMDLVGVVDGAAGTWRWTVAAPAEDPIVKVRVAEDSVVLLRQSNTLQVHDLRTGVVRLTEHDVAALGVARSVLLVSNALCEPDCLVRSLDLRTGRELWKAPRAWTGNALMEPGEVFRDLHPQYRRTLRAPQPETARCASAPTLPSWT